jgi:acyl-CoA thioesterase YciA
MTEKNRNLPTEPKGELVIRTLAMPADTNPSGDIFGGWLLCQMDIGGGIAARGIVEDRVTTIAITSMRFWSPVHVGDTVCVHAELLKIGNTSLTFRITAWAVELYRNRTRRLVTEAEFTYVSIDDNGKPVRISKEKQAAGVKSTFDLS